MTGDRIPDFLFKRAKTLQPVKDSQVPDYIATDALFFTVRIDFNIYSREKEAPLFPSIELEVKSPSPGFYPGPERGFLKPDRATLFCSHDGYDPGNYRSPRPVPFKNRKGEGPVSKDILVLPAARTLVQDTVSQFCRAGF